MVGKPDDFTFRGLDLADDFYTFVAS